MISQPKNYQQFHQLEEQMLTMGKFFSEYFRKTMAGPRASANIDFTLLELKGLAAFMDVDIAYTMGSLSKNARLPLSNMTMIINRFVKRGIASRLRSEQDRRVVLVRLTAKGKVLRHTFFLNRAQELEKTLGKLSQRDQQQLVQTLAKATRILNKIRE